MPVPQYRHRSVGKANLRLWVAALFQVKRAFLRIWQWKPFWKWVRAVVIFPWGRKKELSFLATVKRCREVVGCAVSQAEPRECTFPLATLIPHQGDCSDLKNQSRNPLVSHKFSLSFFRSSSTAIPQSRAALGSEGDLQAPCAVCWHFPGDDQTHLDPQHPRSRGHQPHLHPQHPKLMDDQSHLDPQHPKCGLISHIWTHSTPNPGPLCQTLPLEELLATGLQVQMGITCSTAGRIPQGALRTQEMSHTHSQPLPLVFSPTHTPGETGLNLMSTGAVFCS